MIGLMSDEVRVMGTLLGISTLLEVSLSCDGTKFDEEHWRQQVLKNRCIGHCVPLLAVPAAFLLSPLLWCSWDVSLVVQEQRN
jgi:hypothetical protein